MPSWPMRMSRVFMVGGLRWAGRPAPQSTPAQRCRAGTRVRPDGRPAARPLQRRRPLRGALGPGPRPGRSGGVKRRGIDPRRRGRGGRGFPSGRASHARASRRPPGSVPTPARAGRLGRFGRSDRFAGSAGSRGPSRAQARREWPSEAGRRRVARRARRGRRRAAARRYCTFWSSRLASAIASGSSSSASRLQRTNTPQAASSPAVATSRLEA